MTDKTDEKKPAPKAKIDKTNEDGFVPGAPVTFEDIVAQRKAKK
ncbi:MAG: hypothetical protein AAF141_11345 [Pseudomonadota bacterium]